MCKALRWNTPECGKVNGEPGWNRREERRVDGKSRPRSQGISHSEGSIWLRLIAFKTFSLGLFNLTSKENSILSQYVLTT